MVEYNVERANLAKALKITPGKVSQNGGFCTSYIIIILVLIIIVNRHRQHHPSYIILF